jgi:predicted metal-dependent enzyme (double-stranded beta helix superfamily)
LTEEMTLMDLAARPPFTEGPLTMADLCAVVRSVAAAPTFWSEPLRFDPVRRWSRVLHADDRYDLWVLTWLPGQGTDLHDHGTSAGAFTVLRGSLVEARPNRRGRLHPEVLPLGFTRWVAPYAVHQVRNVEQRPAVSVHAYSPPLRSMTSYDTHAGRLVPLQPTAVSLATEVGVA